MKLAGEQGHEEGLRLAQELLSEVRQMVQGVYLMPSYGRYDVVGRLATVLSQGE
jgi:homocysteine S-methyltransferase